MDDLGGEWCYILKTNFDTEKDSDLFNFSRPADAPQSLVSLMDLCEDVKGWIVCYETSVNKPANGLSSHDDVGDDKPAGLLKVSGSSATATSSLPY